jgi:hypothetical protein
LALLIWVVSTRRTDPVGYTHIASSSSTEEAERARKVLERHGIPVRLDDHTHRYGRAYAPDIIRLLVPTERLGDAGEVLGSYIAEEQRQRYVHIVT